MIFTRNFFFGSFLSVSLPMLVPVLCTFFLPLMKTWTSLIRSLLGWCSLNFHLRLSMHFLFGGSPSGLPAGPSTGGGGGPARPVGETVVKCAKVSVWPVLIVNGQLIPAPLSIWSPQCTESFANSAWVPIFVQTSLKPSSVKVLPPVMGTHCSIRPGGVLFGFCEQ